MKCPGGLDIITWFLNVEKTQTRKLEYSNVRRTCPAITGFEDERAVSQGMWVALEAGKGQKVSILPWSLCKNAALLTP